MSQVDVLIITALKEEYEAARDVGLCGYGANSGIAAWEDRDSKTPTPYIIGNYYVATGCYMTVALARPTRMGSTATGSLASSLVERLKPRCLAMCGVCAGNPADVALGDVIVAELAYTYDEGKRTEEDFEGDHRQIPLSDVWLRSAQDLSPVDLPSYGEASEHEAKIWLLERLNAKEDPRAHPARDRYFLRNTWSEYILSLEKDGFVARNVAKLSITKKGRSFVQQVLYDDLHGPKQLPFKIVAGPIASGNVVVKDGRTWTQLKQWGVRTVVGLEMEAAMIASTAHRLGVANWVVAKGVMDHANPRKDDRYKGFAAHASAEVLFKLLVLHVIPIDSPHIGSQASPLSYEDRNDSRPLTDDTITQPGPDTMRCLYEPIRELHKQSAEIKKLLPITRARHIVLKMIIPTVESNLGKLKCVDPAEWRDDTTWAASFSWRVGNAADKLRDVGSDLGRGRSPEVIDLLHELDQLYQMAVEEYPQILLS